MKRVLVISLLLNLALVITIVIGGSFTGRIVQSNVLDPIYERDVSLFDHFPVAPGDVVFLGDTLVAGGHWTEMFPERSIRNRGIVGDTSRGVRERLDQIVDGRPAAVLLMVGTFDVLAGRPRTDTVADVEAIVGELVRSVPEARVLLMSVLPRDLEAATSVARLNADYARIAEAAGIEFLDLGAVFSADGEVLTARYSNDGMHLNGPGYAAWAAAIAPWLDRVAPVPAAAACDCARPEMAAAGDAGAAR